ncbi:hypothetical protein KKC1_10690, partial [Calderihabitans maritimus]
LGIFTLMEQGLIFLLGPRYLLTHTVQPVEGLKSVREV